MKKILALVLLTPLALGACGNVKKNLGLERNQPDEFAVVERAPLTMPPNFDLLPPQPGATGPQQADATAKAQDLVLGSNPVKPAAKTEASDKVAKDSIAEDAILSRAAASASKPVAAPSKTAPVSPVMKNAQ